MEKDGKSKEGVEGEKTPTKGRTRKSEDIASTPARNPREASKVTPGDRKISEREQKSSKKKREEQKRTMDQYFGGGERILPPSKGGTPVQSILLRRGTKSKEKSTTVTNDDLVEETQTTEQPNNVEKQGGGTKAVASEVDLEGREGMEILAAPEVDLEGFSTGLRPKGQAARKRDKKKRDEKQTKETKVAKTQAKKTTIAFGPTTAEEKAKTIVYKECVVGFAIRVDKGNNAKQSFDKKLMEGLQFIQQYVDKHACFLSHDKSKKLEPIRTKNDMPKYQVVMKGYFLIPNNNSFSNVQQENGRVVKGSGLMGFELDPQQCLEEASGDLRSMGCSIFFKKCQEVDTISNFIFLGVPNTISEETVKATVDKVLQNLEGELVKNDKEYKIPIGQKDKWIKYAITKEYPGGMPWEDQEEKKKNKQGSNSSRLAFTFHVYRPEEQRLATLLGHAKYLNLWHEHWGGIAYTVEQPDFTTPAGVKDRYIEMVQSHGSMQLSMGAATIPGITTATRKFTLRLTPDENGQPRAPTEKSLMDILRLMEVSDNKKVWLCVSLESNGIYTGYFSSVVDEIKTYVAAFIRCPAAQVYYWLKRKGCLGEDVNRLIRKCFSVDQQQKVTKSKYIKEKGFAVMKEGDENDIINAANNSGLFDMSLGLSDKEQRERAAKTGYNESAISFGEAKVGSMEAYNFSSGASITTLHEEKEGQGTSVASAKTMAKSVFSIATNITSGSEGDEEGTEGDDMDDKSVVEIDGMEMVGGAEVQSLTDNMNRATENLQLGSYPSEGSQGDDSSDDEDSSYTSRDDTEGTPQEYDINSEEYEDAQEVSSGEFDAVHANKFQTPENFKQQLWNEAGPTVDSMIIQLVMIKDNLEEEEEGDEVGMPVEWMGVSKELRIFLDEEAGKGRNDQLTYIDEMIEEMYQMNPTGVRNFDPLNEEQDEEQNASKTQGTPPRAQKARPEEEAAMSDMNSDRDEEGVQSLGMAPGD